MVALWHQRFQFHSLSGNPAIASKPSPFHPLPPTDHRMLSQPEGQVRNCRVSESIAPKNLHLQTGWLRLSREPFSCDNCQDLRQSEGQCPCTCLSRLLIAPFVPGYRL